MNEPVNKKMHLLIVALLDDSYLEDVILGLTAVSGGQVTIIDAVSGTQNLSSAIPMFAEFVGMSGKKFCKILLSCVLTPAPATSLLEALSDGGIDFVKLNLGEIYAVPLSEAVLIEDLDTF